MDLVVKQDTVGTLYNGVPSINTTKIITQVFIGNGETVVLGGITRSDRQRLHHQDAVLRRPAVLGAPLPPLDRARRRARALDLHHPDHRGRTTASTVGG